MLPPSTAVPGSPTWIFSVKFSLATTSLSVCAGMDSAPHLLTTAQAWASFLHVSK